MLSLYTIPLFLLFLRKTIKKKHLKNDRLHSARCLLSLRFIHHFLLRYAIRFALLVSQKKGG